jgi:lipoyl(octanoyl) transferase
MTPAMEPQPVHDETLPHEPAASASGTTGIEVIHIPRPIRYRDAFRAQVFRRDALIAGNASEALFLLEHQPVITLGRNARAENLLCDKAELRRLGIEVHEADRGGDVTYHGPGQLVAYPILNLRARGLAIKVYLRLVEQVLIDLLEQYGLKGERIPGLTGVWVGGAKVAAIGVGVRRWVTYHGLALNIDPDMSHFARIIPCGIADKPVTSLRALLASPPPFDDVRARLETLFLAQFAS